METLPALKSAEIFLSQVGALPPVSWLNDGPESLRSPSNRLDIYKNQPTNLETLHYRGPSSSTVRKSPEITMAGMTSTTKKLSRTFNFLATFLINVIVELDYTFRMG
ncbi:hypothetical protein PoB_006473200 [Plakobranchus ocellatus]|uniref:Uncharacterized protein n=1 Tax=Plakobranchus ocellatus TaxID=259542 RepID=A0AAV4D208_9GAST|nr:hypothetical protein PoB_006473200 [Plakobranchus ocellatus]